MRVTHRTGFATTMSYDSRLVIFILCAAVIFAGAVTSALAQQGWSEIQRFTGSGKAATLNSVYFDGDYLWVVGSGGLVQKSVDYGQTFEDVGVNGHENFNDVYVRKDRIWIVGDVGAITVSTDNGKSFSNIRYIAPHRGQGSGPDRSKPDLYSVQFVDKNRGFIVGDQGLITTSTDGGYTWKELESRTDAQLFHLSFRGKKGWAVGTGGVLLHTDDGGESWYPQRSGTDKDLNRIYFINDKVGMITGDSGLILRTEDGGVYWEPMKSGVNQPLFGISFIDKKTGWIVGYQGLVIRTYDGGKTWIRQASTTNGDLFGVSFNDNIGFAIGRDGLLLKYFEKR